jgi:GT2 family glycosyltransferase
MRIAVGIPTSGRAAILAETLADLGKQSRRPDRIVVCCARREDAGAAAAHLPGVEFLVSEPGLTRQRNRILEALRDCDIVVFLDDDFLMQDDYLAVTERLFASDRTVVGATGVVLGDGAQGAGLSLVEARRLLARDTFVGDAFAVTPVSNAYGCNMAIRLAPVLRHDLRFDERLPLYGWQEDADFCCRLGAFGRVVQVAGARGVHLGTKSGRTAGIRLGYSQIVNPLYIARRVPAYTHRRAFTQAARNVAANLVRAAWPEPWIDRRGRLRGNLIGFLDVLRGRLFPERMLLLGAAPERQAPGPAQRAWPRIEPTPQTVAEGPAKARGPVAGRHDGGYRAARGPFADAARPATRGDLP